MKSLKVSHEMIPSGIGDGVSDLMKIEDCGTALSSDLWRLRNSSLFCCCLRLRSNFTGSLSATDSGSSEVFSFAIGSEWLFFIVELLGGFPITSVEFFAGGTESSITSWDILTTGTGFGTVSLGFFTAVVCGTAFSVISRFFSAMAL